MPYKLSFCHSGDMKSEQQEQDDFHSGKFPDDFVWGVSSSCYQTEGAWSEDGKGANIWDTFSHEGRLHGFHRDSADVACDSYHNYEQDIQLIKALGVQQYRFSISWSRLLPDGTISNVNEKGVDYYNRLINGLLEENIQPFVTLYHWDLPQTLQDIGGWTNKKLIDYFDDYARFCFSRFGDRVKFWTTFNEPALDVSFGFGIGWCAPGIRSIDAMFEAGHTVILAHTRAWRSYDRHFRPLQSGQVGIVVPVLYAEPKDPNNPDDVEAAERLMQLFIGWFCNPIYGDGDYPAILKAQLTRKAKDLGLPASPLPTFTELEKRRNKGCSDFFGCNYYSSRLASSFRPAEPQLPHSFDNFVGLMDVLLETDPTWKPPSSPHGFVYVVPRGLRKSLCWIREHYCNPPVYITENGVPDSTGTLDDTDRIDYIRDHINETLKAINLDGCDVRGYMVWSLLDSFEWLGGYSERFGLHHVDFNDPRRTRTPKASAKFYAGVVRDNGLPAAGPNGIDCQSSSSSSSISEALIQSPTAFNDNIM